MAGNPLPQTSIEEIELLRHRLAEAEETLRAIRSGQVDALVVSTPEGERVFTLKGADEAYQLMVEAMGEGAVTTTPDGVILYANRRFAELLGVPTERAVGSSMGDFVMGEDQQKLLELLDRAPKGTVQRTDMTLRRSDGGRVPIHVAARFFGVGEKEAIAAVVTDLTELAASAQERKVLIQDLSERVRELTALHLAAQILQQASGDTAELLHRLVAILPSAFRYPDITAARVAFDSLEAAAPNFHDTPWKLQADLAVGGKRGTVEVCYLEPVAEAPAEPFLPEERQLLDSLAEMLRAYFARSLAEQAEKRSAAKLEAALVETIRAMAVTIEKRDPFIAGHQQRVAELASAIATDMGLPLDRVKGVYMGALIHDIGTMSVPAEILGRPGRLSRLEVSLVQIHSQAGYDIIKDIRFPWPIADMILQHQERLDGSGYPNGLKNGEIILEARILGVANVVEAMCSHRPYRPAPGVEAALRELTENRGKLYDPEVVDTCVKLFREKGFDFPTHPVGGPDELPP
jgi:PAS domain S-box-containing protein